MGLRELNNSYIKQGRITTLWKYYLLSKGDYEATLQRAIMMGVSKTTARSYMDIILARVDKLNKSNNIK